MLCCSLVEVHFFLVLILFTPKLVVILHIILCVHQRSFYFWKCIFSLKKLVSEQRQCKKYYVKVQSSHSSSLKQLRVFFFYFKKNLFQEIMSPPAIVSKDIPDIEVSLTIQRPSSNEFIKRRI